MIMRLRGFELEIQINENSRTILTILNKPLFRKTIMDLKALINNQEDNDIVIEEDNKILNYDKDIVLLTNYYDLDFVSKSVLSAINKKVETLIITNSDYHIELENLYKKLSRYLQTILLECEVEIACDTELDITDLLKMVNLKVVMQNEMDCLEKLYAYVDLLAFLQSKRLLILSNLKANFTTDEILKLYKYLEYKKIKWICIENESYDNIILEKKYLIDEDLIEFDYSE